MLCAVSFQLLDEKGIKFHFQTTASEFFGSNGKLKEVVLTNGTRLPADLCVMGLGGYRVILTFGFGNYLLCVYGKTGLCQTIPPV